MPNEFQSAEANFYNACAALIDAPAPGLQAVMTKLDVLATMLDEDGAPRFAVDKIKADIERFRIAWDELSASATDA